MVLENLQNGEIMQDEVNSGKHGDFEQEGVELKEAPVDAVIRVSVSSDLLHAYLYMESPLNGGKNAAVEDMLKALNAKGVVYGIDMDALTRLQNEPVYFQDVLVASGTAPINGENAEIKFFIDLSDEIKPKEKEDGSVDFHDLSIIQNVSAGQLLCSKIPATSGTEGKAVTGKELKPVKGKDIPLPAGKNTVVSEDKLELRAGVDGQVSYSGGRISVLQTFEVRGNVDVSTGDIKFVGNLVIRGNVASGFTVEAGGNIEIWGFVEAAVLKAGGNITIHNGINGMNNAMIECRGDLNSKFIENADVIVFGSVKTGSIINSNVKCGETIELMGGYATIMGGDCTAGKSIVAKTIGTHTYISTRLDVGTDPTILIRQKELEAELACLEKECENVDRIIGLLEQFEAANRLDSEKIEILDRARTTKPVLCNQVEMAKQELDDINEKMRQSGYGKIVCSGQMFPGTQIHMGYASLTINAIYKNCTLTRSGDTILIR